MRPEAHSLASILAAAVETPSEAERRQYVDQACGGDAERKRRVEELIEVGRSPAPPRRSACAPGRLTF